MSASDADLLVFSDDWGRHPSSCQHIVRELLDKHQVYWVNTIGTRPPRLDLYTLQRGAFKLASWIRKEPNDEEPDSANPQILNPLMWPSFRSRFGRQLNVRLVSKAVRRALSGSKPVIGITTLPIVADLIDVLPVDRWIYYCVDDLSEWPGLDKSSLEKMERRLVDKVDDVIAVSERLQERMAGFGRRAPLLTHGVDLKNWSEATGSCRSEIEALESPRIIFWGVVDQRLNLDWIEQLGKSLKRGSLVFIGPDNTPDPRLASLPRVRRVPAVPFEELPGIARSASVLIMPYADLPSTRAMQPLKLKEYLATGKPVVISDLPAVKEWRDACDVASSADQFVARVLARLNQEIPAGQAEARRRLAAESWSGKAQEFAKVALYEKPSENRASPRRVPAMPRTSKGARILFLTERFPHPLHDGGSLRSYHVIRALALDHTVTVLAQGYPEERGGNRHFLDDTCEVRFVPRTPLTMQVARNLIQRGAGQPLMVLKNWSKGYFEAADALLSTDAFDVVHCNHLDTAWYVLSGKWRQHKVFDTHNCLSGLYGQVAVDARSHLRPVFRREASALARLERKVAEVMDLVLVCSEDDQRQFRALASSVPIEIVGNGVDTEYFRPREPMQEKPGSLVFTGNMGYFPNRDAMLWFTEQVRPRLKALGSPPVRLEIVGSNPCRAVRAMHDGKEVVVLGRVVDVRPHIATAQAFVVPIRYGSGTRLKILDAMSMGKVVVSTTKGAEGLDVTPGQDILIGDTADEFAKQVLRVLESPELRAEVGAAAREAAVRKHDWSISERRLRDFYARFAR